MYEAYKFIMIGSIPSERISDVVNILMYVFTGILTFLTIVVAFTEYFRNRDEEELKSIIEDLNSYPKNAAKLDRLYDKYRLISSIYRHYEIKYEQILQNEDFKDDLNDIFSIAGVVISLSIMLAISVAKAWFYGIVVLYVLVVILIGSIVLIEKKLVLRSKLSDKYPKPEVFLNPFNDIHNFASLQDLNVRDNLFLDLFYHSNAVEIDILSESDRLYDEEIGGFLKYYAKIYSLLDFNLDSLRLAIELSGHLHYEIIKDFHNSLKHNRQGFVICRLHLIDNDHAVIKDRLHIVLNHPNGDAIELFYTKAENDYSNVYYPDGLIITHIGNTISTNKIDFTDSSRTIYIYD